ncbi:MAG: hypothetical protein ACYDHH_00880 [Solirubrobacteraceae bacterium]
MKTRPLLPRPAELRADSVEAVRREPRKRQLPGAVNIPHGRLEISAEPRVAGHRPVILALTAGAVSLAAAVLIAGVGVSAAAPASTGPAHALRARAHASAQRPPCGHPRGHCQALWYTMGVGYSGFLDRVLTYSRNGVRNYYFAVTQSVGWHARSDSAVLVRQFPHGGVAISHANLDGETSGPGLNGTNYQQTYYDDHGADVCNVVSGVEQPSHPVRLAMTLHVQPTDPDLFPYRLGTFSPSEARSSVAYAGSSQDGGVTCPLRPCPRNVVWVNPADHPSDAYCHFSGGTAEEDLPAEYVPNPDAFADATQDYVIADVTHDDKTAIGGRVGSQHIELTATRRFDRPPEPYDPYPELPPDRYPNQSWELKQTGYTFLSVHLTLCPHHGLRPC